MPRLLLLGYFGAGNFGDDALLTDWLSRHADWMTQHGLTADVAFNGADPLAGFIEGNRLRQHVDRLIDKPLALKLDPSQFQALIAPGGFHMIVTKEHKIHLTTDPPVNYVRPAADVMMFSMAEIYGVKNVGVVLTGMGSDGAKGIKAIKEHGGYTIAQDEATSVVYGMPNVAFQTGCVDKVAPLDQIPRAIIKACN